jgi:site-specific recombinase XerD
VVRGYLIERKWQIEKYIQELLGRKSRKTADIYTCVAMEELRKIESSLDLIMSEELKK